MQIFSKTSVDPYADHWLERLEAAVMAMTFAASCDLPEERRKALYRQWLIGTFDGAAQNLHGTAGIIVWEQAGPTHYDLTYHTVKGFECTLGRAYRQPDGSWAALVIAGVRDTPEEAQAAAEWAISRLIAT